MSKSFSALHHDLIQLAEPIRQSLLKAQYNPPEASNVSVKSMLESLLPQTNSPSNPDFSEAEIRSKLKDFGLCCAALASSAGSTYDQLSWIPNSLSLDADSAFRYLSKAFSGCLKQGVSTKIGELGFDLRLMSDEKKLAAELMVQVLPSLKASIKESSIDKSEDGDEVSAAVARSPVAQCHCGCLSVDYPHLGRLCPLVIPCALTSLDHWSPEVKGQGMISFIHLAKNVNAAELSWYEDVILDACCQNIVSSDEIWHLAVEMSVALLTCIQPSNPRSSWIERMLSEMLSHLERQPRNKERRLAWLKHIEQLFNVVGLWMHTDDDETILLVLERVHTVIKLTWIRNTPYIERLVDELATLYKEAALKIAREEIRAHILQILILLQQCKGPQFKAAWDKHKDDPNLTTLEPSLSCMAAVYQRGGCAVVMMHNGRATVFQAAPFRSGLEVVSQTDNNPALAGIAAMLTLALSRLFSRAVQGGGVKAMVNLSKFELIPMGEVARLPVLAACLGLKSGKLASFLFGTSLGDFF
ncbi:hypothetical protein HYC85_013813 [Camellia sinensis]|uniref:Uncharacterized protein n=1 Tax=Camellia sinensis TaxID=4442 RepID=A0A7J7H7T5_CAMSI|nr:hypothetical protein HYC85_013813 [Camellia sinensis]